MEEHEDILEYIRTFLKENISGLLGIYLFGSRAQGRETAQSDWDVAFLTRYDQKLSVLERWKLQEKLAAKLNRDVDLVDLRSVSTVMQFQVLSTGCRIYCKNEESCGVFEMLTYSFYQRLQEERKDILSQIKETGQVYHNG